MIKADSDTLNNLVIDYNNKKDINIILDIDNLIYRLFDLSPDQIEYMDKINLIG